MKKRTHARTHLRVHYFSNRARIKRSHTHTQTREVFSKTGSVEDEKGVFCACGAMVMVHYVIYNMFQVASHLTGSGFEAQSAMAAGPRSLVYGLSSTPLADL